MALKKTLEYGSEFIFDFCCTSCRDEDRTSEANYFCQDCTQFFCNVCNDLHNKLHKKHDVLCRKDVDKWRTDTAIVGPLVRCDRHPCETVKLVCVDRSQLCCHVCVSVQHKQCSIVKHIPEIASGFNSSPEFRELPEKVSEIQKRLALALASRKANKDAVYKSRGDCLKEIRSLREQCITMFDCMERCTVSEVERQTQTLEGKIQTDFDTLDDVMKKLGTLHNELKECDKNNEATTFIIATKCEDMIWKSKAMLQAFAYNDDFKMVFKQTDEMKEFLSTQKILGKVICTGGKRPQPRPDHLFKVEKRNHFHVRETADSRKCNISGMCALPSGELVLADNYNSKLKLMDYNYKIIATCEVPNFPQDVCCTDHREVVVAVNNYSARHEIIFVRIRPGRLERTRSINVQHNCYGVTHHSEVLYVATYTAVHAYDMKTSKGRELYSDETEDHTACKCAVSSCGGQIFVTDNSNSKLIALNTNGTTLYSISHTELTGPSDVHTTPSGHVFVSCFSAGTVWQISNTHKMSTLVNGTNSLTRPTALCLNSNNALIVAQHENDDIVVFELQ